MLMFSKSEVSRFVHTNKALRWGQAFYNAFKLHKVSGAQDKEFCDRLYNEKDDSRAKAFVQGRTDMSQ